MALDDLTDFVTEDLADIALDLIPDNDGKKRRRSSGSMLFWIGLIIAMVAVFWLVFTA